MTKMHYLLLLIVYLLGGCSGTPSQVKISHETLRDKIKGAWAMQTIGVTYGGPTEFRYLKRTIPDTIPIAWEDTSLLHWMKHVPGLYDDIYMDLTFVEVMEREGIDAPATSHGKAYAEAGYFLWHANQQGRYNILTGMSAPASGHWLNNPHADDIDFQIEADFAGIMHPAMPNTAAKLCDKIGHIMNSGDGYYGGVFVAGMYSHAFYKKNVSEIIEGGLALIPQNSTFFQCIRDVIQWRNSYPEDWKKTWGLLEEKWGNDIGCPDGAASDFNIDAKMNAAYVALGLLYGKGDIDQTLEITTRCGQDSDCNPATAGGILGTMLGYSNIPEKWMKGLSLVEDMDFQHTQTSLNDVYDMSYRHALEVLRQKGVDVKGENISLPVEMPFPVPYEQNFPNYKVHELRKIQIEVPVDTVTVQTWEFEGIGVVLRGRAGALPHKNTYALMFPSETLDGFTVIADIKVDNRPLKTVKLPLHFIQRAHEIFYQFDLAPGKHTLTLKIKNYHPQAYLELHSLLIYGAE